MLLSIGQPRVCDGLSRRHHLAGALSHAQIDSLSAEVLALQTAPAIAWYPRWGDLVQEAQAVDSALRLSPSLWQRYIQQASSVNALVRARVRIGDPIPIAITCEFRAGSDFTALENLRFNPTASVSLGRAAGALSAAAQSSDSHGLPFSWSLLWLPAADATGAGQAGAWPPEIAPGPQTLSLHVSVSAMDADQKVAILNKTFSLPLKILSAEEPSVALRHDAPSASGGSSLEMQMARSIRLNGVPSGFRPLLPGEAAAAPAPLLPLRGGVIGSLWISSPPVCASFRVVLRQKIGDKDQREWGLARLLVRPDDAATIPLSLESLPLTNGPSRGPAQIVCIPDPSMAAGSVDILEVWGDPLVFPVTIDSGPQ